MDLSQLPEGVNPYVGLIFILVIASAPSLIGRIGKPRRKAEKERAVEKGVDETSKKYEELFDEQAERMKSVLLQLAQINLERAQLAQENSDLRRELRETRLDSEQRRTPDPGPTPGPGSGGP